MSTTTARYELREKLGEGGMGTVYRGVDTANGTAVAVKVLKQAADAETLTRFQREGEALRLLNHPNIVKLLDAAVDNGQHVLVMELMPGGSLAELLRRDGRLSVGRALKIALDLADALTRAHHLHIIHRDLKPGNVLIADDNTPRLTDFGMAHTVSSDITESGMIIGTAAYIAPEIYHGAPADTRSDIWSFGVLLFEMLAGIRPFQGESFYALLQAITQQPPPDLEALCPHAPVALVDLIYRMLSKTPSERIPSIRLVGAELEAILDERPPLSSVTMPDEKTMLLPKGRFTAHTPSQQRAHHNLPFQVTPFVGRTAELDTLGKLLRQPDIRLITLHAPGGMGKTRLSLEIALQAAPDFMQGVYLVELAPYEAKNLEEEAVITATAQAVGFQFVPDSRPPKQQMLDYFREKSMLLVMDNFEHLIAARTFIDSLLTHAPHLKILVTSRERLNLTAETVFNLGGLAQGELLEESAAVQLFLQSARRVQPGYAFTADELAAVAQICRMVDGMPLAIVLAAAWMEVLTPAEISAETAQNIDFLQSDLHDLPTRQRSLRAVFDYSWRLLSETEQGIFVRLAVFHGGFTRQAAQTIARASLLDLTRLMNKALLRRDAVSGRYELHEVLRQYAVQALTDQPKVHQQVRDDHCRFFAALMARLNTDLKYADQIIAHQTVDADFENVRAAWLWAIDQRHTTQMLEIAESLMIYAWTRSRFLEGIDLFDAAMRVTVDDQLLGVLKFCYADLLMPLRRRSEAYQFAKDGVALTRAAGERKTLAYALWVYAITATDLNHHDNALEAVNECVAISEALGDTWGIAMAYHTEAYIFRRMRVPEDKIIRVLEKSIALHAQINNLFNLASSLNNLALALIGMGEYEAAKGHQLHSLQLRHELRNPWGMVYSYGNLGNIAEAMGEYAEAARYYEQAGSISRNIGMRYITASSLLNMAEITSIQGDFTQAAAFIAEAQQIHPRPAGIGWRLFTEGSVALRRGDYHTAVQHFHDLEADEHSEQEPRGWLAALSYLSLAEARLGDLKAAASHLRRGLGLGRRLHMWPNVLVCCYSAALLHQQGGNLPRAAELAALVQQHRASRYELKQWAGATLTEIEPLLSADAFAAAVERGQTLNLDSTATALMSWGSIALP